MKNRLIFYSLMFITILFIGVSVCSCNNTEDNKKAQDLIIGKWLMVSRTFNGTTYSEKDRGLIWEFYQDNTASIDAIDGLTSETTWYIYEDLLTFGPETIYKIKELTLDSLVLTFPNDQSVLITFEKKDEKEQKPLNGYIMARLYAESNKN